MVATLSEIKEEWRLFRHDQPGERFRNHRERMKRKSRKHAAVAIALGVLLVIVGIVLLFMPGPGIPLILFGVALVGSHSKQFAAKLDRAEPRLRERGRQLEHWWRELPRVPKGALITSVIVVGTLALVATGELVGAYLL